MLANESNKLKILKEVIENKSKKQKNKYETCMSGGTPVELYKINNYNISIYLAVGECELYNAEGGSAENMSFFKKLRPNSFVINQKIFFLD